MPPRVSHFFFNDTATTEIYTLSLHDALPISTSGSSRRRLIRHRLTRANGDGLPPSLHEHYTRFIATARQSAPLRRIGTFGLAVGAACAFSLSIAGQVLTFHTSAWFTFAPSPCRTPLLQTSGF